jgi:hypothetical protein
MEMIWIKWSYLGLLEQVGMSILHLLLKLPWGFLNTVIPPLDLHKRDGLGPQLLLFAVQHLDGQLFICKIWLNIKRLVVNHMWWIVYELPQQRDVEDVMNARQIMRHLNLVCN